MTDQTRISAKGQIVIPKAMRERLRLEPGLLLDVSETPDGAIVLRPKDRRKRLPLAEAVRRIRAVVRYDGPPLPVEELGFPSPEEWRSRP